MAYVLEPIVNVSTLRGSASSVNVSPFESVSPSATASIAKMFVGSLMSIIWTPSVPTAMAYVLEPIVNVEASRIFVRLSNVPPFESVSPSVTASAAPMSDGLAANASKSDGECKRSEDAANNKMNK